MICDFYKIFKPTPQQELDVCKSMFKLHQELIGHCCTCFWYKGTDMPGLVTDYGECLINEPKFVDYVLRNLKDDVGPCANYKEDTKYAAELLEELDRLEREVLCDKWNDLGEQYLVEKPDRKGE